MGESRVYMKHPDGSPGRSGRWGAVTPLDARLEEDRLRGSQIHGIWQIYSPSHEHGSGTHPVCRAQLSSRDLFSTFMILSESVCTHWGGARGVNDRHGVFGRGHFRCDA